MIKQEMKWHSKAVLPFGGTAFTYPEGGKFTVKIALYPEISVRPLLEASSIFVKVNKLQ